MLLGSISCSSADLVDYRIHDLVIATCKVDLRHETLRMFWKDDNRQPFNRFSRLKDWLAAQGEDIVCATNAGIFDQDYRPLGLYIENGAMLRKLNEHKNAYGNFYLQPNGAFLIGNGHASIIDTDRIAAEKDQMLPSVLFATQSGPLLIKNGKMIPLFSAESENRLIRNAVCTTSPYEIILAISRGPISFYEFAQFLLSIGCTNALYLDGRISSMYPGGDADISRGFGPIIAVTKKTNTGK
jgi:uncharacterized protein YigE (DUF2233 family)